jgi:hypothetical protein
MQRIERANSATIERDENSRLKDRQPCALLEESACTAYADRPLVCRGMASNAAAACESAFTDGVTNIPTPAVLMLLKDAHAYCLTAALHAQGLSTSAYELNNALWVALTTEHAEERWLGGEEVFAGVDKREVAVGPQRQFLEMLVDGARGVTKR